MKTKKEMLMEMIDALENDALKLEILKDYRTNIFENDPDLKGNLEAKKELDANEFTLKNTKKMLEWCNKQLILCE